VTSRKGSVRRSPCPARSPTSLNVSGTMSRDPSGAAGSERFFRRSLDERPSMIRSRSRAGHPEVQSPISCDSRRRLRAGPSRSHPAIPLSSALDESAASSSRS
jgi:hypothetical protein